MDTSIFYDIRKDCKSDMPFKIIIGPRGCGKTYSVLDYMQEVSSESSKFIYMRRDGTEIDSCASDYGNPFKSLNMDKGYSISPFQISKFNGFGIGNDITAECIGYGVALSTFASMRSQDFSDVDRIFFEEFIPEKHKRKIKGEGQALLNVYETINRNRELKGEKPVEMIMCANGIDLANPILLELGATSLIAKMLANKQRRLTVPEKQLYIEIIPRTKVSEAKEQTALYKLANKDFIVDALDTTFRGADLQFVRKGVNLRSYKTEFSYGNYVVFSNKEHFYIAESKVPCKIAIPERELQRFKAVFGPRYRILRGMGNIYFDDYVTLTLFDAYLDYEVI
ncbi:MAG: phage DNA encapsidation protein [Lachnospiraceae bacterium]|nr:phage DNA encapsidation protein [Lachnospiraceae bacterium]